MHVDPSQKDGARQFLDALKQRLEGKLTNPAELRQHIRGVVASSKVAPSQEYMSYPEGAFLHTHIILDVFALIREQNGFSDADAPLALLCEGFKNIPNYSSGSPSRTAPHPFDKTISTSTEILRNQP